jgi:hypothetical protein
MFAGFANEIENGVKIIIKIKKIQDKYIKIVNTN